MSDTDALFEALADTLGHLHDPEYQPTEAVCLMLGCAPSASTANVQAALARMVEDLAPDHDGSPVDRAARPVEVLYARFVRQLTQEETAERLHLSLRTVQREQRRGVYMLARRLLDAAGQGAMGENDDAGPSSQAGSWREQLKHEVALLQRHDRDTRTSPRKVLDDMLPLAEKSAAQHGALVRIEGMAPNRSLALHPSTLRQILLTAISELAQNSSEGTLLDISFQQTVRELEIIISVRRSASDALPDTTFLGELVSTTDTALRLEVEDNRASLIVVAPFWESPPDSVTVLAVDDNLDLVTLYQSYCEGTQYEIVHLWDPRRVFEAVETHRPNIVLLDILLPDTDGWDLLLDLHAHESTCDLPIIVCSVITNEELALALGASLYLQKPVWRPQLIDAFARVLRKTETTPPPA